MDISRSGMLNDCDRPTQLDEMAMRDLINRVIASFRTGLSEQVRTARPDEMAYFQHLREAFIVAGAAKIRSIMQPQRWIQIGVHFDDVGRRHAFLSDVLLPEVERWLQANPARRFFFMNKPPGVRARFFGVIDDREETSIVQMFESAQARGVISRWERGIYEGETYQFGGEEGMAICHEFFTLDSLSALRMLPLFWAGTAKLEIPEFSMIVLNDLFRRLVLDSEELWDVWCNMALTGRLGHVSPGLEADCRAQLAGQRDRLHSLVHEPATVVCEASPEERAVIQTFLEGNKRVAERLADAERRGALLYGIRKILPFYVIFHWNRLGLRWPEQVRLCLLMRHFLDPKEGETICTSEARRT